MSSGNWMRYLKKIKPYTIKKGFRYLKHYGPKEFWVRLCERMEPEEVPYGPWFESHKPTEKELEAQRKKQWKKQPLISVVVPAYKTPEKFLREMIKSLEAQTYTGNCVSPMQVRKTQRWRKCSGSTPGKMSE